ncbi:hypothetical protein MNBD_GAMMA01-1652, partial [hydrothermal vent metagenome]
MEFEFNFGEQQISTAVPVDPTLYASVAGTVQQLSKEELVFMEHQTGQNQVMTMQVLQAMGLTQQFKPMHEHIQTIEANIAELRGQASAIDKVLGFLKNKGLIISDQQWLDKIKAEHPAGRSIPHAGMVIRTCQRPDNLQRLIDSYANYFQIHGGDDSVLVFDDSADVKSQEANQKVCQAAKINVKYHGSSWQQQFITMLKEQFVGAEKQIDWLLAEKDGFTGGRVWNLALLALAGKKFSFYDDDYLIQPRKAEQYNQQEVNLADQVALDVGFGLSVRDIKEKSQQIDEPVLQGMIDACGDYFGHWLAQDDTTATSSLYGWRLMDLD